MSNPDLILTADWHLRDTQPVCRTDNFWETQWNKVKFISDLQKKYDCPIVHAGDLFDHWKPSPFLLSETIKQLPKQFYTVYGNHDLPQHNFELKEKSGIYVLEQAGVLEILGQGNWGNVNFESPFQIKGKSIFVWHTFVYKDKPPYPNASGKARTITNKAAKYDLIVTGDNHQSFEYTGVEKSLLVNPGCITRQSASEINYEPCVWLWYAESNTVKKVLLPYKKGAVTREHIEKVETRNERIDAFISKLEKNWEAELDFENNVRNLMNTQRVRKQVKDIIYKFLD